jgi:hypothetical protein
MAVSQERQESEGILYGLKGVMLEACSCEVLCPRWLGEDPPTMHSTMHLYPIDGDIDWVGADETDFAHQDATYSQVIVGRTRTPRGPTSSGGGRSIPGRWPTRTRPAVPT